MMEMNFDVIKSYFNFIHEYLIEGGYFLNVNRYEKKSTGYPIRISDYPYDTNWKVIISEPSFKQNWIHFLLTQRSFIKDENDIVKELENIKIIGRKFYGLYTGDDPKFETLRKFFRTIFGIKLTDYFENLLSKIRDKFKKLILKLICNF